MDIWQNESTESQPLAKSKKTLSSRVGSLTAPIALLLIVVGLLWVVEIADWLLRDISLDQYGIHPRTSDGLWQIFVAPFLHADFAHLIANTIPLLILGYLIIIRDRSHFLAVFAIAAMVSGLGIWLFAGADTVHLGASGVVFGFMGYLLGRGYFERSFTSIAFGVVALLLYGGILIGVLPGEPGVSWLGHLFGLVGGVLAAYLAHRAKKRPRRSGSKPKAKELDLQ